MVKSPADAPFGARATSSRKGEPGARSARFSHRILDPLASTSRAPRRSAAAWRPTRMREGEAARERETATSRFAKLGAPMAVKGYHTSFHDSSVNCGRIPQSLR